MKQGQFEKYVNLIRKSAHAYASKWGIEYDEIEAQGFLIYCNCLKDFDPTKSGFSTHLSWELKRLNDFCKTYKRQRGELIQDYLKPDNDEECIVDTTESIPAYEENTTLSELLEIGFEHLSNEAYRIFKWILERSWEQKGRQKPSISLVMNTFNYSRVQAEHLWNEIGNFYTSSVFPL